MVVLLAVILTLAIKNGAELSEWRLWCQMSDKAEWKMFYYVIKTWFILSLQAYVDIHLKRIVGLNVELKYLM